MRRERQAFSWIMAFASVNCIVSLAFLDGPPPKRICEAEHKVTDLDSAQKKCRSSPLRCACITASGAVDVSSFGLLADFFVSAVGTASEAHSAFLVLDLPTTVR